MVAAGILGYIEVFWLYDLVIFWWGGGNDNVILYNSFVVFIFNLMMKAFSRMSFKNVMGCSRKNCPIVDQVL